MSRYALASPHLVYTDRRGGGVVQQFKTAEACWARLNRLRLPARVMVGDEEIGGIEDRAVLGGHDDRRRRWNPWLDMEHPAWRAGQ